MFQHDSITGNAAAVLPPAGTDSAGAGHRLTPARVLRMLPADATPEQQDSAIQACFSPGEIHYSERPDTLHLPCHGVGRNPLDVEMEQVYEAGFFSSDTLLHPEVAAVRRGVAGDPVPYTVRDDDMITGLLLLCSMLVVVALSNSRRFIVRQVKDFVYGQRAAELAITETASEVRFQMFLLLQTCLQFAIFQFFYTQNYIGTTFILSSDYHLIGIYFAMFAGYFVVRGLLHTFVNTVFFGDKRNLQMMMSLLFITSSEGIVLLPVVMLLVYFDLPMRNVTVYFAVVLILVKILTLYKCYFIFFRRIGAFLQIILYFCALEIVPAVTFWCALVQTGNHLKINF